MRSEKISFKNADGVALADALDLPPGNPRAFALFAHCFSCSSQSHAAKRIAQALTLHGIATQRLDFTAWRQRRCICGQPFRADRCPVHQTLESDLRIETVAAARATAA